MRALSVLYCFVFLVPIGNSIARSEDDHAACKDAKSEAAIPACTRLLDSNRLDRELRGLVTQSRAYAYSHIREPRRAITDFSATIRIDPKKVYSFIGRGHAYSDIGDLDRALSDHNEAVRLAPKNSTALFGRAHTYMRKKEYDLAIADLNEAIRIDPRNRSYLMMRANVFRAKGDIDRAIADLDVLVRAEPKNAEYFVTRGSAYVIKKDFDRAIAEFSEAIRLNPALSRGFALRGTTLSAKGDLDRAITDLTEAIRLEPSNQVASSALEKIRQRAASNTNVWPDPPASPSFAATSVAPTDARKDAIAKPDLAPSGRVALVIGNGRYEAMQPLPNPPNDAADIAQALKNLGFKVTLAVDAKRATMEEVLAAFAREARQADTAMVFYAGHGLQHQGVNYLAPVDARMTDETDLRKFVRVQNILEDLQNVNGVRILILDACRDNEAVRQLAAVLPKSRNASLRGGLAGEKAEGVIIAYATQPDRVAADGDGRNSPFTAALLKNLPTPGVELRTMFTRVRAEVLRATGGTQRPETSDSLDGEVVLSTP